MSEDRAARLAALRERAGQIAASTQPYLPDTLWLLRTVNELLAEADAQGRVLDSARTAMAELWRTAERATAERDAARAEAERLRDAVRRGLADVVGCCPECDAAASVIRHHVDPHMGDPAPTCATCGHRPDQHRKGENLRFCLACPDDQDGTDLHPYTPTAEEA